MQAHFINNRSMEVFRPLDGLADDIAARSPPLAEWRKFIYCESLTGRVFGQVDHFQVRPHTDSKLGSTTAALKPQVCALCLIHGIAYVTEAAIPYRCDLEHLSGHMHGLSMASNESSVCDCMPKLYMLASALI